MSAALGVVAAALLVDGRRATTMACALVVSWFVAGVGACVVIAGAATIVVLIRRARTKIHTAVDSDRASLLAVETVGLSMSAGLTFEQASEIARSQSTGVVRLSLDRARRLGTTAADAAGSDVMTAMFAAARRSAATGAALVPLLDNIVADARRDRHARERERLARLPVKLLFPLALLILPGFVLMLVAPAVVGGLTRIGI